MLLDGCGARRVPSIFDSTPCCKTRWMVKTVTLAALSKDEPVLLYFWASWVRRFAASSTPEVRRSCVRKGKRMTIALPGNEAEVSRWLSRKGVDFPVINDANRAHFRSWRFSSVTPTLVVNVTKVG